MLDFKALMSEVPDFPKPGILFRDISCCAFSQNALVFLHYRSLHPAVSRAPG